MALETPDCPLCKKPVPNDWCWNGVYGCPVGKPPRYPSDVVPTMLRVRFQHKNDGEFPLAAEGRGSAFFDRPMSAAPRVGDQVQLPTWFYHYVCEVSEVIWNFDESIPCDVVVRVES
jgi:hypothetical protein